MIYKIPQQSYILPLLTLIFFADPTLKAQVLDTSKYGTPLIRTPDQYRAAVSKDSRQKMVELKSVVPLLVYDLRYAGTNNFVKKKMYPGTTRHTFMRRAAAEALSSVQQDLNAKGYGLKVYDAYRPYTTTVSFWELIKDERYVAHPAKGSGHNRGLAIDCTIINLSDGKELDMGTGFDNFSDTAHHSFAFLSEEVLANRKLFRETMTRHGFRLFETEWWHYSWPNDAGYDVMDLPFKQLARVIKK